MSLADKIKNKKASITIEAKPISMKKMDNDCFVKRGKAFKDLWNAIKADEKWDAQDALQEFIEAHLECCEEDKEIDKEVD